MRMYIFSILTTLEDDKTYYWSNVSGWVCFHGLF